MQPGFLTFLIASVSNKKPFVVFEEKDVNILFVNCTNNK